MSTIRRMSSRYIWIGIFISVAVNFGLRLSPLIMVPTSIAIGWIMGRYSIKARAGKR